MKMIRVAGVEHFQQIANIVESLRAHANFRLEQFNWNSDSIIEELGQAKTLVIEDEQKIVSFLCYRESADAVEITALATKPDRQKQGFQTLLLEELKKRLLSQPILLEVHAQNMRAQTLYKHLGFIEISRRKNYYRDGSAAIVLKFQS
ncbi:MAG: GNAT family N-acetyltransferase [Pseudobdellovibrio sp.]